MDKMCRQNMLEGWLSSVTQEAVAGMFPGAADATNFAKSKELDIKWLEEDLSVSTLDIFRTDHCNSSRFRRSLLSDLLGCSQERKFFGRSPG
jgi:hypothetical protein